LTWRVTKRRLARGLNAVGLLRPAARLRETYLTLGAGREDEGTVDPDGVPLPPPRLRMKVDGSSSDADRFLRIAGWDWETLSGVLADAGVEVESLGSVLDFGCGCGRVARQWRGVDGVELHGCDIDPELVEWCNENLGFMTADLTSLEPPTAYLDHQFDFIYAFSVFTHFPEPLQGAWMAELRRLLKPGGWLLFTTIGELHADRLSRSGRRALEAGELVVEHPRYAGKNLCTAYHPRAYVTGRMLDGYTLVRAVDGGSSDTDILQDVYLVRRAS
jgi:SAM-dependent methyltransferase